MVFGYAVIFKNKNLGDPLMNSALADIIGFLNGLTALGIIACGGVLGWNTYPQGDVKLTILGLGAGLLVALFVCGILAIFISMRAELIEIRELLERKPPPSSNFL